MNYLFKNPNNGHYSTFRPFTCNKEITQEDATKFMLIKNPSAGRTGSTIADLVEVAGDNGYEIKPYNTEYRDTYAKEPSNLDPLPVCFLGWRIIDGISGNY